MDRSPIPLRWGITAVLGGLLLVSITPARNAQGSRPEGSDCTLIEVPGLPMPQPPSSFFAPRYPAEPRVTVSGDKASLSWMDNSTEPDSYAIYRRLEPGPPFPPSLEFETARLEQKDLTRRPGGRLEYVDDLTLLPQDRTIVYEVRAARVSGRPVIRSCYSVPTRVSVRRDYTGILIDFASDRQMVPVEQSLTVRVHLSAPAPGGGVAVALSSSTPDLVPIAQHLLIAPGATEGMLSVRTRDRRFGIGSPQRVQLTAAYAAQFTTVDVFVTPAP